MSHRRCVLRVRGAPDAVEQFVALALVQVEVLGVVEHSSVDVEVGLDADGERWSRALEGLDVALSWCAVDDRAPVDTGLEDDRVIEVAAGLIVRPPWVPRPDGFDGIDLVVPRGSAFGSGEHGSTQAALVVLHRQWCARIAGGFVADVGCGSGILAAYAQQRGALSLGACDIEVSSVRAASELLGIEVGLGGPEVLAPADTVLANLDDTQLRAALPTLLDRWTGRGGLLLSGTRSARAEELAQRVPAKRRDRVQRGDFVAMWFEA